MCTISKIDRKSMIYFVIRTFPRKSIHFLNNNRKFITFLMFVSTTGIAEPGEGSASSDQEIARAVVTSSVVISNSLG